MTEGKKSYYEKLKDPRWQKKRLEILNRDNWQCQVCKNKEETLHVHHKCYTKEAYNEPWSVLNSVLVTLCLQCHRNCHAQPKEDKYLIEAIYECGAITPFDFVYLADCISDSKLSFKTIIEILSTIVVNK